MTRDILISNHNSVVEPHDKHMQLGQQVEFTLTLDQKGPQAENIVAV